MPKYPILKKEQILNKFLNASIADNEKFHLYINSPFCVNQCSYCKHKGEPIKTNANAYKEYFESYLPNLIEFYSPVLKKHIPNAVYFGGGSASIMTAKTMENIFNKIPNFIKIPEKTFECDVRLLTKEKIQLLIDCGFTNVSFGVQTFNEDILKKNNRLNSSLDKIKETVNLFQKNNIFVNCDLMTLIDDKNESDFRQLIIDMKKMTSIIQPNKITLYPESYIIEELIINNKKRAIELIVNLQKTILKNIPSFNNYFLSNTNIIYTNDNIEKNIYTNYKFYKSKEDESVYKEGYNSTSFPDQPENHILLGIGSFKHRKSYSYIKKSFYVEENNLTNNLNETFYALFTKKSERENHG